MTDGYIKLFRSLLENPLYKGSKKAPFDKCHAWIDLLLTVNFKETRKIYKDELQVVKPGEICTSIIALSERWHWSRDKVSRFLNELELLQMVRQKRTPYGTTLTIENWGKFQTGTTTHNTTNAQPVDNESAASKSHNKKERKKERKNTPKPPQKGAVCGDTFYTEEELAYHKYLRDIAEGKIFDD